MRGRKSGRFRILRLLAILGGGVGGVALVGCGPQEAVASGLPVTADSMPTPIFADCAVLDAVLDAVAQRMIGEITQRDKQVGMR